MTGLLNLPPELHFSVQHHLAQQDLLNLCRVCKSLYSTSEASLYRDITLRDLKDGLELRKFAFQLRLILVKIARRPDLANRVERLTVLFHRRSRNLRYEDRPVLLPGEKTSVTRFVSASRLPQLQRWIMGVTHLVTEAVIAFCLLCLRNLTKISLTLWSDQYSTNHWYDWYLSCVLEKIAADVDRSECTILPRLDEITWRHMSDAFGAQPALPSNFPQTTLNFRPPVAFRTITPFLYVKGVRSASICVDPEVHDGISLSSWFCVDTQLVTGLKVLSLEWQKMPSKLLAVVLARAPKLEVFTLRYRLETQVLSGRPLFDGKELVEALRPCRKTLRSLTIAWHESKATCNSNLSHLLRKRRYPRLGCLSDFKALERLSVHLAHLRGNKAAHQACIVGLLPPNLNRLQLSLLGFDAIDISNSMRCLDTFVEYSGGSTKLKYIDLTKVRLAHAQLVADWKSGFVSRCMSCGVAVQFISWRKMIS